MNSRVALITFLDGGLHPDQGLPGGGQGGYPDNTLPGYGGPVDPGYGQGQPMPPHPWRPGHGRPPRPDQGLPGSGAYPTPGPVPPPIGPDNTLPDTAPPPQISLPIVLPGPYPDNTLPEGQKFELKYSVRFGWVIVAVPEDPTAQPK